MLALPLALVIQSPAWSATSQTRWGVSIEQIQNQMANGPEPANELAELQYLWRFTPFPKNLAETTIGLNGGITFAFDDNLCGKLLPRFREDIFYYNNLVNCDTLRASVFRAFNVWGSNNANLNFIDVTEECQALDINHFSESHRGPPGLDFSFPNGFHGGCPLAEIWVTDLNADVTIEEEGIAVATALSYSSSSLYSSGGFHFTNGFQPTNNALGTPGPRKVKETYAGKLSIRTSGKVGDADMCWYLDSYWCSGFHGLKRSMGSANGAKALMQAICWLISVTALLYLIFVQFHVLSACFGFVSKNKAHMVDRDGDGNLSCRERCFASAEEMADYNPLGLAIVVTLFISPLMVLYQIIMPCWDCADFEGAMIHEVGHFLGLGHPDTLANELHPSVANVNPGYQSLPNQLLVYQAIIAAGGAVSDQYFRTPLSELWANVKGGVPPGAEVKLSANGYYYRPSVMEAFTQHNPRPCLEDDDVEALSTLYPDPINGTSQSGGVIVCLLVNHNIGLVRLTVYVIFPVFFALVVIMAISSCIHCYQVDELETVRIQLEKDKAKIEELEAERAQGGRKTRRASFLGQAFARRAKVPAGSPPKEVYPSSTSTSKDLTAP